VIRILLRILETLLVTAFVKNHGKAPGSSNIKNTGCLMPWNIHYLLILSYSKDSEKNLEVRF